MQEETYMRINKPPNCQIEYLIHAVMGDIAARIESYYQNTRKDSSVPYSSRQLVTMLVTNILVNLMQSAIKQTIPANERLETIQECIAEISSLAMDLWTAIETQRVPTTTAN